MYAHTHAASTVLKQKNSDVKTFLELLHSALPPKERKTHNTLSPSDIRCVYTVITAPHLTVNRTVAKVS